VDPHERGVVSLRQSVESCFDASPGHGFFQQKLKASMDVPHSQAVGLALQDVSYELVHLPKRPPAVRRRTVRINAFLAGLMTIGTCETLEKALELLV
jgi:hypothetical protein